jgi:TRAP transporter TAXI family solute receptor
LHIEVVMAESRPSRGAERYPIFGLATYRELVIASAALALLLVVLVWASLQFLKPIPPRHIVLASGAESGLYHRYAQRYKEILARSGVTVEERITAGAAENLRLLLDPAAHVDVAFMQGGVAEVTAANGVEMVAALYYEPMWIFVHAGAPVTQLNELQGKRIAIGAPGSGTRVLVQQLLRVNGVAEGAATMAEVDSDEGLSRVERGDADVAILVGGADTPVILEALSNPRLTLVSMARADAYARRFSYISKLILPPGMVDLAHGVPEREVTLIGSKAMLAARHDLHPALTALFISAAREIHQAQGAFESAGEFPSLAPVDLPVSAEAALFAQHGPTFLQRYLPFWLAAFVERALILLLPLAVVAYPLAAHLPAVLRWRFRARIFRCYEALAVLQHDISTGTGTLSLDAWHAEIDRIDHMAEQMQVPPSIASEGYGLRVHIAFVRDMLQALATPRELTTARATQAAAASGPPPQPTA